MKKALTISCLYLFANLGLTAQTNTFPASGNVGVGTTSPTKKLEIHDNIDGEVSIGINNYNLGMNAITGIRFGLKSTPYDMGTFIYHKASNNTFYFSNTGDPNSKFSFITRNASGNFINALNIGPDGNVGIGTTSPSSKFHINTTNPNSELLRLDNNGLRSTLFVNYSDGTYDNAGFEFKKMSSVGQFKFSNLNGDLMTIRSSGSVGIGTSSPDAKLTVKGNIHTNEVKVDLLGAVAPDYVFENDYNLKPLNEVENYITKEKHLPNIPSAKNMEIDGILLKEFNLKLLEKIEELTLYTIQQEKKLEQVELLKEEIKTLKEKASKVEILEERLQNIEALLNSKNNKL